MTGQLATQVIKAGDDAIAAAVRVLAQGGLVAFPTETVYGLGADAQNGEAVARLYDAKGRPTFNPLIAHAADTAAARRLGCFNAAAQRLASAFWPGPLTLVLPKRADCPVAELATAGLDTIAVRVPNHPVAHRILAALGRPVVAPSANRSGHVSPTTAEHVLADLRGRIELIVDGGATPMGLESTIVACLDGGTRHASSLPTLLRPGGLPRASIDQVVTLAGPIPPPMGEGGRRRRPGGGIPPPKGEGGSRREPGGGYLEATDASVDDAVLLAPGQMSSHYAPCARLRLDAHRVQPGEALLAFGPIKIEGADAAVMALNLSQRGDLIEAAANFFSHLRALDAAGPATIAVMPVPRAGLGEAINDRLQRAAAPR
jgi:L-threonylcarbamoyladenylate synthase